MEIYAMQWKYREIGEKNQDEMWQKTCKGTKQAYNH